MFREARRGDGKPRTDPTYPAGFMGELCLAEYGVYSCRLFAFFLVPWRGQLPTTMDMLAKKTPKNVRLAF